MTGLTPNYYRAYLLRLWCEDAGQGRPGQWRASLEDPRTGDRLGFSSLEQLFAYLVAFSESAGPPPVTGA